MILEILQDGDKRLLKKSKRVAKIDDTTRELAENLVETMLSANGVGLAAPQCGILKQVIVVLVNEEPKVMINPELIFTSNEKEVAEEGCLSIPQTFIPKERYSKVTVKYRNIQGHPHLETHEGLTARVIQHEMDHLLGVLMTSDT